MERSNIKSTCLTSNNTFPENHITLFNKVEKWKYSLNSVAFTSSFRFVIACIVVKMVYVGLMLRVQELEVCTSPGPDSYPARSAGRHVIGDFSNGPAKREMSFLTVGYGDKKRKTNNIASQSGPTKQKRSFETGG